MLNDEEKKELLDGAASARLREDFRRLREASLRRPPDLDQLMKFLTAFSRFAHFPPRTKSKIYKQVLL